MFEVLLIGAGQLGSRHLQGILKSQHDLRVTVVDPNSDSLEMSRQRAAEVNHLHEVVYASEIPLTAQYFDLAVVATNSNVRSMVTSNLLRQAKVRFLVLEKVLFQTVEEYDLIEQLLEETETVAYVNHARRMQSFYQDLQLELQEADINKVEFNVYGTNWGLACNGLHLIDLATFLIGKPVSTISSEGLDQMVHSSKRQGYIEFTGTLTGQWQQGGRLSVSSYQPANSQFEPLSIVILTPEARYLVQEGGQTTITRCLKSNSFLPETNSYKLLFQSDLSKLLVDQLISEGDISLPKYNEAKQDHVAFIKALLKHYNHVTSKNTDRCLIT